MDEFFWKFECAPDIKIDYVPGAHGRFLQALLLSGCFPDEIDLDTPWFNELGACHNHVQQANYGGRIGCAHFSHYVATGEDCSGFFRPTDKVIQIMVPFNHRLTVLINHLLKTGDTTVDLDNLEQNTLKKIKKYPKYQDLRYFLIDRAGKKTHYSRSDLRIYFDIYLRKFVNPFLHTGPTFNLDLSIFFNYPLLIRTLDNIAKWIGLAWRYDERYDDIWQHFMHLNRGLTHTIRCDQILQGIKLRQPVSLSRLSAAEEAWIVYNLYPHAQEAYPILLDWPNDVFEHDQIRIV